MQNNTTTVIVLYTLTAGRKTYVSSASERNTDKRLVPHFNTDINKAKPFLDEKERDVFLAKMVNAQHQQFHSQQHTVPSSDLQPVKLPA